jgi:hypothetical protein
MILNSSLRGNQKPKTYERLPWPCNCSVIEREPEFLFMEETVWDDAPGISGSFDAIATSMGSGGRKAASLPLI